VAIDYTAWFESARAELSDLQRRKNELRAQQDELRRQETDIDRQINGMAQTVSGLASLLPQELPEPTLMGMLGLVGKTMVDVGIRNRIRTILQAGVSRQFSAVEIRDELQHTGFNMGDYANALATIYTTLKRMVAAGDVVEHSEESGKRYQWNPFPSALVLLPQGSNAGPMTVHDLPVRRKVIVHRRTRNKNVHPLAPPAAPPEGKQE
jgi:hypothetical protein